MNGLGQDLGSFALRRARLEDAAAMADLIPRSVRGLQAAYYSPERIEAALGTVFAVDRQLLRDGTYFVAEAEGRIVGCGGWSRRQSLCGGDHGRTEPDGELDPARDAARLRAFFVDPSWARRGIGRTIVQRCEIEIADAGFQRIELSATLAGEPLYAAMGYTAAERSEFQMPGGLRLPVVRMTKLLTTPAL